MKKKILFLAGVAFSVALTGGVQAVKHLTVEYMGPGGDPQTSEGHITIKRFADFYGDIDMGNPREHVKIATNSHTGKDYYEYNESEGYLPLIQIKLGDKGTRGGVFKCAARDTIATQKGTEYLTKITIDIKNWPPKWEEPPIECPVTPHYGE
jgi:hypothetical protein